MLKFIIFSMLLLVLVSSMVFGYPIIISESGVNHTQAKELVYSIPEKYYKYVDVIEFVNEPIKVNENNDVIEFGKYKVFWNNNHYCYNGKITIWNYNSKKTLIHELGHIYEHCYLNEDISTEEFANDFNIK